MSNQHVLKIHPAPLADLLSGAKTAEVRRNDRGFQVGDTVRLMEVNPETLNWTGRPDLVRTISHIQTGYGLPDGICVLSYAQAGMELVGYANFDRLDNMLDDRTATVFPDRSSYAGTPVYRARAALATQPAPAAEHSAYDTFVDSIGAHPTREQLSELYREHHAGHPADFALDVLERWGPRPAVRGAEHDQ
ncbi:DUF3850 domain-containing protein [Pseudomonas sp. LA5]|uniref:DUF3850 domain-containing protein n=1 Tax=Pseudomonas sp. LA5 TaxID=3027850 RepID=UPI002360DCF1|nr:DUF3850 domain-containing protein [Pseudomonas sp. LA5]